MPLANSRNISLIWENENGEMVTLSKEIILSNIDVKQSLKVEINQKLAELNEFEKIEFLKDMLQEALEA